MPLRESTLNREPQDWPQPPPTQEQGETQPFNVPPAEGTAESSSREWLHEPDRILDELNAVLEEAKLKRGELPPFDVPLLAEKLLAWASEIQYWRVTTRGEVVVFQHRYQPDEAAVLSPREWLRSLSPAQFGPVLSGITCDCISFMFKMPLFTGSNKDKEDSPRKRQLAKELGVLTEELRVLSGGDRMIALPPIRKQLEDWYAETPRVIQQPDAQQHDRRMRERDEKIFINNGVRYRPLPLAAQMAQAPRQTLLNWIKNKTEFGGQPLASYYLAAADRYFVSEDSIQRMKNRFVKWPSNEPAEAVTVGKTKGRSGFIGMAEAAAIAGVSKRTMWLWASQGKAPTEKPLDVVKCTTSDHFYIREKDAYELKKLVPKSGLQRGRRPQLAL
jgi:hypothetical protein